MVQLLVSVLSIGVAAIAAARFPEGRDRIVASVIVLPILADEPPEGLVDGSSSIVPIVVVGIAVVLVVGGAVALLRARRGGSRDGGS